MRGMIVRCAITAMVAVVFAFGATGVAANANNDNRIGVANPPVTTNPTADGIPCRGLYTAGVGWPPGTGGATVGTPGYAHVFENDEEMCHFRS